MKKAIALILALLMALSLTACGDQSSPNENQGDGEAHQKVTYSVGTTSVGGVYNTVATAWGQTLEKHSYVNWDVQVTGGAVGNLQLYANGELDMPMSIAASMLEAQEGGTKSFPDPITDLTVLMKVNQGFLHICARTGSGINSIEDLKGKKISTAEPGHSTELLINALFDILGWDIDTDIQAQKLNLQDSVDALADGRIDAMFYLGGCPVAGIQEACVTSGTGYKFSKGCFNSPTETIKFFDFFNGEGLWVKISIDGLVASVRNSKSDDAEVQIIHIGSFGRNVVKCSMRLDPTIPFWISR